MLPILWNMLFLWMVGREMESMYGSREFTFMYLTAAVFSNLWLGRGRYPRPQRRGEAVNVRGRRRGDRRGGALHVVLPEA